VVKVSSDVMSDPNELESLASSLSYLWRLGLCPVVIHGTGLLLDNRLKSIGVEWEYHDDMRVTTELILREARRISQKANDSLVDALERHGVKCRPITGGVFGCQQAADEKLGYVGDIVDVNLQSIQASVRAGSMPILTCMGETATGQILNMSINAAATELSLALKPLKVVFVSCAGGIYQDSVNSDSTRSGECSGEYSGEYRSQRSQLVSVLQFPLEEERSTAGAGVRGNVCAESEGGRESAGRMKKQSGRGRRQSQRDQREMLQQINSLLGGLPVASSVSVTCASNLVRELFTHAGQGTLCRRRTNVIEFGAEDWAAGRVDKGRLGGLLASAFNLSKWTGGEAAAGYLRDFNGGQLHRIYVTESYTAAAILLLHPVHPEAGAETQCGEGATASPMVETPYMCKFAASAHAQGSGVGSVLWELVRAREPSLFWRSRPSNSVNSWYFSQCDGCIRVPYTPIDASTPTVATPTLASASTLSTSAGTKSPALPAEWRVFWYGIDELSIVQRCADVAKSLPMSFKPKGLMQQRMEKSAAKQQRIASAVPPSA
jgi:acetylglutamate kinase